MVKEQVKRIVFLAAGMGTRMTPITINTPKPLVRVNGIRMIDTLLDAALEAGIEEIYIVRGYLGTQFNELLLKYPMIRFIDNPDFNVANNISSIVYAADYLSGAYICEADLVLRNKGLISGEQEFSNYIAVPTEETDDWCFTVKDGIIQEVHVGGKLCHHMFGISYWSEADGKRLGTHAKELYATPEGKSLYWDEVALRYYKKEYQIHVRECSFTDISEIDTFADLQQIDSIYEIVE